MIPTIVPNVRPNLRPNMIPTIVPNVVLFPDWLESETDTILLLC